MEDLTVKSEKFFSARQTLLIIRRGRVGFDQDVGFAFLFEFGELFGKGFQIKHEAFQIYFGEMVP